MGEIRPKTCKEVGITWMAAVPVYSRPVFAIKLSSMVKFRSHCDLLLLLYVSTPPSEMAPAEMSEKLQERQATPCEPPTA